MVVAAVVVVAAVGVRGKCGEALAILRDPVWTVGALASVATQTLGVRGRRCTTEAASGRLRGMLAHTYSSCCLQGGPHHGAPGS